MMNFTAKLHGYRDDGSSRPWPDYGDNDYGLNEFSSGGSTPTGLMELDLNTPENNPKAYGPYPVNRVVRGKLGNGLLMLPNIRDGILIHTGEWPGWKVGMEMPNSAGCIHIPPND